MDNQTEGNYYQPYRPEDPAPAPPPRYYDGNQNFATLSLVMGILALVSLCCFPFISIPFAGLGILFSCLSKGRFSRPGPAKAGLAISSTLLACFTYRKKFSSGLYGSYHFRQAHRTGSL